eukprot:gnl/Dysnectes_brevis/7796_a13425_317.p1 GENE.gnl/Dysnectes_brevis/7796_a13425_317~~gnl/Dysnectes_brevis/7796_a13425_317.p1  ORF type:complete len:125 (-),score=15.21 gnl/Dysnectes_brevis/7796_a13425_317:52-426(-)
MVRFKVRYIVLSLTDKDRPGKPPSSIAKPELQKALRKSIQACSGLVGLGQCSPSLQIKYNNGSTGLIIIRCAHDGHKTVIQAVKHMSPFLKERPVIEVIHCGGTLRQCFKRTVGLIAHTGRATK